MSLWPQDITENHLVRIIVIVLYAQRSSLQTDTSVWVYTKLRQDERKINNKIKLWFLEGKPTSIIFPLIFVQSGSPVGESAHKRVLPPILRLNHYKAVKTPYQKPGFLFFRTPLKRGKQSRTPTHQSGLFLVYQPRNCSSVKIPQKPFQKEHPKIWHKPLPVIKMGNFNAPSVGQADLGQRNHSVSSQKNKACRTRYSS